LLPYNISTPNRQSLPAYRNLNHLAASAALKKLQAIKTKQNKTKQKLLCETTKTTITTAEFCMPHMHIESVWRRRQAAEGGGSLPLHSGHAASMTA